MGAGHFKDPGMFTGSGHIEAACKQIVVQRTKPSGMHWSVEGAGRDRAGPLEVDTTKGAADIIALRCQHASGGWNDFITPGTSGPPAGLRAAV